MTTVTFYSYKGGTGRTLLVANTALFLASAGSRVAVMDLDLEAPGLPYKFGLKTDENWDSGPGVVGHLALYLEGKISEVDVSAIKQDLPPLEGATGSVTPHLVQLSQGEGVEFILAMKPGETGPPQARGLENPEHMAVWARQTLERLRGLGERLQLGALDQVEALGPQRNVALGAQAGTDFCIGWKHSMSALEVHESTRKILALWAS